MRRLIKRKGDFELLHSKATWKHSKCWKIQLAKTFFSLWIGAQISYGIFYNYIGLLHNQSLKKDLSAIFYRHSLWEHNKWLNSQICQVNQLVHTASSNKILLLRKTFLKVDFLVLILWLKLSQTFQNLESLPTFLPSTSNCKTFL